MPKTYSLYDVMPIRWYGDAGISFGGGIVWYDEDQRDTAADNSLLLYEGAIKEVTLDVYERNPIARRLCIDRYGAVCQICKFNFAASYGKQFDGLIHVNHLTPLNPQKTKHAVNPEDDLIPVCPNCHMALHSKKDGVYTPEQLIGFMEAVKK